MQNYKSKFKIKSILFHIFWLILIGILGYVLYWRYRLGAGRYFDTDEFSYLFWGYQFHLGLKPYSDFFYFLPPFFLYPVSWIFDIFGRNITAVETARTAMFGVFVFAAAPVFLIIKKMRNSLIAILTVMVFSVLPLPYDKMIEIRPDTLAYGFALWGIYLFFLSERKDIFSFLSGLFFSVSLMIIPKTIPLLAPICLVLTVEFLFTKRAGLKYVISKILKFLLGSAIPAFSALVIIYISGGWPKAFYFMTKFASESTAILGKEYYIQTYQFFGDYIDAYYGKSGFSIPWLFNLSAYVISYIFAVYRMLTSFKYKDKNRCVMEFVVSSLFIINLFMFLKFYPLKHAQYLIPIAPLVGFYLSDLIITIGQKLGGMIGNIRNIREKGGLKFLQKAPLYLGALALALLCLKVAEDMNKNKIWWGNRTSYDNLNRILKDIPKDATVYDLSGGSVFFRTGYYFCCLPYGQYEKALRFNYPDIMEDTNKKNMTYVHTGAYGWGALGGIPKKHADFVTKYFKPFYPDNTVLIKK